MFQEGFKRQLLILSQFFVVGQQVMNLYSATRPTRKKQKHHRHSGSPWHRHAFGEKKLKGPLFNRGVGAPSELHLCCFFCVQKFDNWWVTDVFFFFGWRMRDVLDVNIWNLHLMYLLIFGRCNSLLGKGCIMFMLGNFWIEL